MSALTRTAIGGVDQGLFPDAVIRSGIRQPCDPPRVRDEFTRGSRRSHEMLTDQGSISSLQSQDQVRLMSIRKALVVVAAASVIPLALAGSKP